MSLFLFALFSPPFFLSAPRGRSFFLCAGQFTSRFRGPTLPIEVSHACDPTEGAASFLVSGIPVGLLADGPRPFTLLGKEIVLWRDGDLPRVLLPMAVTVPVRVSKG